MSSDRVPSRTEVMGWSPAQLAAHLKKMNLTGCDKVVLKNSISGSRFVNLSENDLQKFPKLHAPLISKISTEISKKEERRGLFGNRITSKYHEPETSSDFQGGWDPDEFDDEDCDDDYESPYSGEEEGSGGDYESPNEDEYEPNPTEPPEDLPHARLANLPIGDSDYIDNRNNHVAPRDRPPVVCPRPSVGSLAAPEPRLPGMSSSRRDASPSPHSGGQPPGSFPGAPPQISRENKPGRVSGSTPSPVRGPQPSMPSTHPWRQKPDTPDPSSWTKPPVPTPPSSSIGRSNSSARNPPSRFDASRELTNNDVHKNNTFPLQNKSLPPRPGLPGPPSRHGDSLPPNLPSAGSLPHKFSPVMGDHGGNFSGSARQSFRPPPPTSTRTPELDPHWYVGKVTRGRAEECLKRVNKDGAYLVRDSARQLANQPFTLMVLYQDKVFNIQIRQQNQNFLLGTGLKAQESFPSVSDIISHYSQSPLLLIDAKNRRSPQQNQCLLSDPAGFCMTKQSWS
ncbi:lymphocyte cytosolic protein 2a isoform X2 [Cheilinus undulatus]|uniref:lymphocyte cytosolic protein 2a isoform X2 n=1 Tax=Cheilinus undulatus TaxID=241271 RepID=UPI001BD21DCF|nr:lymphocyte cytosolic protein 2a isoform X2 [Cheilinus undulatus]